ncbi:MAG TPA: hypothetical protein VHO84_15120 [Syntrophorhabdaceae bacterium]|nr:hypothetical protein [Syntrophorhabdaceae bacterium]
MEEKELTNRLHGMFEQAIQAVENIRKGFMTQDRTVLEHGQNQFAEMISSNLSFVEQTVAKIHKDEIDRKFLSALIPLQKIASSMRSLIAKQKTVLLRDIRFNVKSVTEITELLTIMKTQFRDARDLIVEKDPFLRNDIKTGMEKILELVDKYSLTHHERLVTGVSTPKESYLYLDIVNSIKRIARELVDFSERL